LTHKYDAAVKTYQQVLNSSNSEALSYLKRQVYCDLAAVYSGWGNYQKAYQYMAEEARLTDSILSSERLQSIQKIEKQLQIKEQSILYEQKLNSYRHIYQTENARLQSRNNKLFMLLVAGSVLLIIIVVWLFYVRKTNLIQRTANAVINKKNEQLEDVKEKIQRQFQFISHLMNVVPTPMFYTENGLVIGCNAAFEKVSGQKRRELHGMPIGDLRERIGFDWNLNVNPENDSAKTGHELRQIKFSDGKIHDVICYVNHIGRSEMDQADLLVIFVDVTDLEQIRRELAESRKKLQDALAVKTKFFSIFAHDLKNPFNGILGMTNLLTEYYDNYTSEEVLKYLNVINDSSTQVYTLLTNLLDWAKTQTGKIDVNPIRFQITELVSDVLTLNNHLINSKNIKILQLINDNTDVFADKNMIHTVLRNILGNALKYTPDNGIITIATEQYTDGMLKISVSDTGVGISPENQQKLFNVDYPISTPGLANEKGSGLGLIISSEFVKRNGGSIWVESELGKGTTFSFCLKKS